MIAYVFKTKRRISGRLVESSNWFGALRLPWEARESRWTLETSDKREAWRRLHAERERREKEHNGVLPPRPQQEAAEMPLNELLDAFLGDLRSVGRAKSTLKKYRELRLLFDACRWERIRDVTPRSFSEWRTSCGLSPKTVNDRQKNTGAFFNWLRRQRMAGENPLEYVTPVDTRRREKFRRALTEDEIRRLLAVASGERRAVYLTALYTGLRRNELRQLAAGDFVFDTPAPFVRVRASTTKNAREAQIRLRPEVIAAVRSVLPARAEPSRRVFAGILPKMPRFKKDLEAAGIPFEDGQGRRADFHALRDTFGTQLAVSGAAPFVVKELMRHSTVQQSERYYIDASHLPLAKALDALPTFSIESGNDWVHESRVS